MDDAAHAVAKSVNQSPANFPSHFPICKYGQVSVVPDPSLLACLDPCSHQVFVVPCPLPISSRLQSAPDEPRVYLRLPCRAIARRVISYGPKREGAKRSRLTKIGIAYRIGTVGRLDAAAIEQEANLVRSLALPLTESIHQLLQRGSALDLEEDLVVVIRHLNVEMLALSGALRFLLSARASVLIRS